MDSDINFSHNEQGFTLLELLVAMSIFVILAAMGWKLFGQLQLTEERVSTETKRLAELQFAYMQMNRDITQYINRVGFSAPTNTGIVKEGEEVFSIGFDVFDNQMSFTRTATFDPRLVSVQGLNYNPAFARITYRLQDDSLIRLSSKHINNTADIAVPTKILSGMTNLKIKALDPAPNATWPPEEVISEGNSAATDKNAEPTDEQILQDVSYIPLGVSISFDYYDTPIIWKFALPKDLPEVKYTTAEKPKKPQKNSTNKNTSNPLNNSLSKNPPSTTNGKAKNVEIEEDEL